MSETTVLHVTPPELHELQEAVKKRESDLKRERSKLDGMGLIAAVQAADDALKVIKGDGPLHPGLKSKLGVKEEKDESQLEHGTGDEPDYRTLDMTVSRVEELVAEIASGPEAPAAKVRILNALEAGERERTPKPRDGALKAIQNARTPIVEQVKPLRVEG